MPVTQSKRPKRRYILPFSTPAKNRLKDFTKNMEMAAVLYLAEATRKKGEYPHLKKTEEKLVFIAEACFPIWLIPYNKTTLIFDGFGLVSHTFFCDITPDVKVFIKDIQRNQKTTDSYIATLTRNMDYFKNFQGKEEIRIEGLITTPDLKEDIRDYLPLMKQAKKSFTNIVFLKPIIKTYQIQACVKKLSALRNKITTDIGNIDASMKFLNATTERRIRKVKEEIRKTREKHSIQIKKTKLKSAKRLQKIQNQYNRKIAEMSKKYKRRLLQLNKKRIKLNKDLKSLGKEAKRSETKIKSSKRRHSRRYEHHWTRKLERIKKQLQVLRKDIKVTSKRIREVEKAQEGELTKQRIACCKRIELSNKIFRDRQGSWEAEIIMKRQEIATIEEIARYITKSMQKMLQKKRLFLVEFERIAMSQRKQSRRLVYMPFYIVRYEKGDKRRYIMYSPTIVGDMGLLAKMKGALGAAKVKTLVQPRSEALAAFLNQFVAFFEKKPMLEKDLTEAGIQKSMLLRKKLRIAVAKGLKQLENEDWISRKELQAFCKILYTYAPPINQKLNAILISDNNSLKCLHT